MIICKELNGRIWLAKVAPSVDAKNVGLVGTWYQIGPGQQPQMSWAGGTEYVINFQYLSHNFTRVVDIATWPPNQVDPITYTPQISIQRGEEWAPIDPKHDSSETQLGESEERAVLVQSDPYVYWDRATDTYHTFISKTSFSPLNEKGYRVYQRIPGGAWNLLIDWTPDVVNYQVTEVGGFKKDYGISWGGWWNSGSQNFPDDLQSAWHEYPIGPILKIAVNARVISGTQEERVPAPELSSCCSNLAIQSSLKFFYLAFEEVTQNPGIPSSVSSYYALTPTSKFYSLSPLENLGIPSDQLNSCCSSVVLS